MEPEVETPKTENPISKGPVVKNVTKGIKLFEVIALIIIAIATVVAGVKEVLHMINQMDVTLGDLLLMFLYLEVLAMVAVYLDTGRLPIRFPMYIAIIALARYLIIDMKSLDHWQMISVGITILLIAASVLLIRYGHTKFPYMNKKN